MFVSIPLQQCSFDLSIFFYLHFLTHYWSVSSSTQNSWFFWHCGVQYRRCHVHFFCSHHMRLLKIWIHPMNDTGFIFLHKFFPLDSSFLVTHETFVFLTHFVTHHTHCLQIVTEIPLPFTVEHRLYIKYGVQCDPVSPLLWLQQWHDVYHFTQQCR
jgi:hypothetical protein